MRRKPNSALSSNNLKLIVLEVAFPVQYELSYLPEKESNMTKNFHMHS